jgi:hypothetical protein
MSLVDKPFCFGNHGCNYPYDCGSCTFEKECKATMPTSLKPLRELDPEAWEAPKVVRVDPRSRW